MIDKQKIYSLMLSKAKEYTTPYYLISDDGLEEFVNEIYKLVIFEYDRRGYNCWWKNECRVIFEVENQEVK